jgi:hypothetical protein
MKDEAHARVSPKDIEMILERAAKEPGINDALALLRLSQEAQGIDQIINGLVAPPLMAYVSGTAGWVR